MRFVRLHAVALLGSVLLASACTDHINPQDDEQPAIPPGVSLKPQRTAPATGGLQVAGQDSVATGSDTAAAVTGDTTPGVRD